MARIMAILSIALLCFIIWEEMLISQLTEQIKNNARGIGILCEQITACEENSKDYRILANERDELKQRVMLQSIELQRFRRIFEKLQLDEDKQFETKDGSLITK